MSCQGFCTSDVPPTNISRQQLPSSCDEAIFQAALTVTLPCDHKCQQRLSCHLPEAKQCFPPCEEEDKLLHPHKTSKAGHNTCKHYRMSVFLILSFTHMTKRRPSTLLFPGGITLVCIWNWDCLTAVLSQYSHTEVNHGLSPNTWLDACENRWLRSMRITYKDRITNEMIRQRTQQIPVSNIIRQMWLKCLGHVLRMKDDTDRNCTPCYPTGKRSTGRLNASATTDGWTVLKRIYDEPVSELGNWWN